jgi:lysine/ornithine N-monooxygenase
VPCSARARHQHNLHLRAYRPVPVDQAVTLEYFMSDYVDHLEHHLAQVLG